MTRPRLLAVLLLTTSVFAPSRALRADEETTVGLRLEYWPYASKGTVHVEGSEANVDDTSQPFNRNTYGFVLAGDKNFDGWGLNMDLFVGQQEKSRQLSSSESVEWTADLSALGFGAYLSALHHESEYGDRTYRLDAMGGLRGYMTGYKLEFFPYDPVNDKNRSDYIGWIDPYAGLRLLGQISTHLGFEAYADAGGFGIGAASELSSLMHAGLVVSLTPSFRLIGGYRYFALKSANHGVGPRETKLNVQLQGPTLGAELRF